MSSPKPYELTTSPPSSYNSPTMSPSSSHPHLAPHPNSPHPIHSVPATPPASSSPTVSQPSLQIQAGATKTKVSRTLAKDRTATREGFLTPPSTHHLQPTISVPEDRRSPEKKEGTDFLPRRDIASDNLRHVSSTNLFASLQTQYPTEVKSNSPHTLSSSPTPTETPFVNPPMIEVQCQNYLQMRKLRAYLEEAKTKYQITKDENILLKIFSEKFGRVGDSEPIVFNDDFDGCVSWEWLHGREWIPYVESEQQLLEAGYQRDDPTVSLPLPKQRDLIKRDSLNGVLTVDLKKLIQTNTLNQSTRNIRRILRTNFIEGFLLKESKLKGWKLVYAVLSNRELSLFSEEDRGHQLLVIPLEVIVSVSPMYSHLGKEEYIFTVKSWKGDVKCYNFSVQSDNILKKWIYHLDLARKKYLLKKAKEIFIGKPNFVTNIDVTARYSIAFCSISTAAYKFEIELASNIACGVFSEFLNKHRNAPIIIYLVDREPDSKTLECFKREKPADNRMIVCSANLVKLRTELTTPCWYIVNASNPKFSEGGSGTNEAIHDACRSPFTPSLQTLTRKLHGENAELSAAHEVPLPEGCPLRENEDVRWVIHVVGPNMNPKRPNYLGDDLPKAKEALKNCYHNVLNKFWELTGLTD